MNFELNYEFFTMVIIIVFAVVRYLAPIVVAKVDKATLEHAMSWVGAAVKAAEQLYKDRYQGAIKKDYVLKFLKDKGVKLSEAELNVLIEQAVREMNRGIK